MIEVSQVSERSFVWDAYLSIRIDAPQYFAAGVGSLIKKYYGLEPVRLVATQAGSPQGVLFGYCTPGKWRRAFFTPALGMLYSSEEVGLELLLAAERWCQENGVITSVIATGTGGEIPHHSFAKWRKTSLVKDISSGEKALWDGLRGKSRNTIRQAIKKGIVVRRGHSEIPTFEHIYRARMLEKGICPQKKGFIRELGELLGERMAVLTAYWEDNPIAGMVFLDSLTVRAYRWNAATPQGLKLNANHFLMWQAICDAVVADIPYLDLGESVSGGGVYSFKTIQFGAYAQAINYVDVTSTNSDMRDQRRRLPLWLHVSAYFANKLPLSFREAIHSRLKSYERVW